MTSNLKKNVEVKLFNWTFMCPPLWLPVSEKKRMSNATLENGHGCNPVCATKMKLNFFYARGNQCFEEQCQCEKKSWD